MQTRSLRALAIVTVAALPGIRAARAEPAPDDAAPDALTTSVDARQFAAVNAVDVTDLVRYAPDLFVSKRFAGDDQAVLSLRGTGTDQSARTLVRVDGFVISNFLGNSASFAPRWNLIGPAPVERVDIQYGPWSARYGGNSMGGVVSVTTREPAEKNGYVSLQSLATAYEEYGVDETFTGYSVEAGGGWKQASSPWSARINVRHLENVGQPAAFTLLTPLNGPVIVPVTGAYVDPRLPAPVYGASSPTDTADNQFNAGVGYEFKSGWKLEGVLFGRLTRRDLTDSRSFITDANGAPVYDSNVGFDGAAWAAGGLTFSVERRSEYLAGIKAAGSIAGWRADVNLSHYWIDTGDTRTANFFFTFNQDAGGTQSLEGNSGWWTFDAGAERRFERQRFAFGVSANRFNARQDDYLTSNWRLASEPLFSSATFGAARAVGAYVEDEILFGRDSSLTLGVRADQWSAYDGGAAKDVNGTTAADDYPDRSETAVSPKLAFRTTLGADWNLQVNLGAATRFPTVGELFQGRIENATRLLDPDSFDPDLAPEHSRDANLMLGRDFGNVRFTSSLFYQDVDDAIYRFAGLNQFGVVTTSYKNVDEVRQFGAEIIIAATDVLVDGLDLRLGVARIDTRIVRNPADVASEDRALPGVPDWRVNGSVQYRMARRFGASIGWRYGSRPNTDFAGLRGDAYGFETGYVLVDARLTWNPNDVIEASLGIDNLNDDKAYVTSPLAQRTGYAGVRMTF